MTSISIEIVIEGSASNSGKVDAGILGDSLLGYSALFRRASEIANGDSSEAQVLVESEFRRGSFVAGLELVQEAASTAHKLIATHQVLSATALAAAIGFVAKNKDSLFELWKWLKGKKPDEVRELKDNRLEITLGQSKKTVTNINYHFYNDPEMRSAFGRAVRPLKRPGVDRVAFRENGKEQAAIEKSEAESFDLDNLKLGDQKSNSNGERTAVLIVSKLSFTEGVSWTFFEQGATVVAKIDDHQFWENVHQHRITFGEGDRLLVRIQWDVSKNRNGKLAAKNVIVKVLEVVGQPQQLRLKAASDLE